MKLLDDSVYWLAALLAVAGILGGGWLTAVMPGRRVLKAGLNALVVALASTLVLSGVFLAVNRQNGWYGTLNDAVADLTGAGVEAGTNDDQVTAGAHSAQDTFKQDGKVPSTDDRALPALPQPGQRIQTFNVPTSEGSATWPVTVVLPPDYFDPGRAQHAYPVLMAGHGFPGDPESYLTKIDIRRYADPAVQAKKVAPFVTVIPALAPNGIDTECVFGPGGPTQVETWLAKDVPAFVKAHLRVIQSRDGWAWNGYSGGAWCGAMITMRHPETFAAAQMLGGYYKPWWGSAKPPWGAGAAKDKEYDLIALAATKPPAVALWVHTSRQDPESWPETSRFLAAAKSPTYVTAVVDQTGGHTWKIWLQHMPEAMAWLGATVPGFKP